MGFTEKKLLAAIEDSGGIIKDVARRAGCSRQTIYNAMDKWPSVRQALIDEKEKLKDLTESRLIDQIQQGNMTAIIFYLKTQAKDRGYVERQEYSGPNGGAIQLDVTGLTDEQLERIIKGDDPSDVI